MKTKTKAMIATFTGVAIGLLLAGFQGVMPFTAIAISFAGVIVLHWVIPSRFDRNFATFEVLFFWIGFPLAMIVENLLGEIPGWLVWTWLGLSLTISVLCPLPFLKKFSPSSFH